MASIGVTDVAAVRRPGVSILVTGNKAVPCGTEPEDFRIVDSISVMLRSPVSRHGGCAQPVRYLRDEEVEIEAALMQCDTDLIIVTGGTSVGVEDFTLRVVLCISELIIQGIRTRPARPIGIGFLNTRPTCLLPGNLFRACVRTTSLFEKLSNASLARRFASDI